MEFYTFKFFSNSEYLKEFRSGKIRFMGAEFYATLDEGTPYQLYTNRYDSTEGNSYLVNRNNGVDKEETFEVTNDLSITISPAVKSFVLRSSELNSQNKIVSFYAIENKDIPDGNFKTALDTMKNSLGDYYICFLDMLAFERRLTYKLDELVKEGKVKYYRFAPVNYEKTDDYAGKMYPFTKPEGLYWQHELRFLVLTVNEPDPFIIDIGSIEDITCWGEVKDLKNGYVKNEYEIFLPNHHK